MFVALGEAVKGFVVNLIKIALSIALLVAIIAWARENPDVFQRMVGQVGNMLASVVTWACDLIIGWTS